MNSLRLASCWIAAIAITVGALALLARPAQLPRPDFGDAKVAVIGTSLVHRAVPASGLEGELLPGKGPHIRIGLAASTRTEMLTLVEQASADGVDTILLEANPLIFSLPDQSANLHCASLSCAARYQAAHWRRAFSAGVRALLGLPDADAARLENGLSEPTEQQWQPAAPVAEEIGFTFHAKGTNDIADTVAGAKAQGVEIALLLPPRSPSAESLLPEGQSTELEQRAHELAAELGVPLFAPKDGWTDADFVDRAHMSKQGRARFLRELRTWWVAGH